MMAGQTRRALTRDAAALADFVGPAVAEELQQLFAVGIAIVRGKASQERSEGTL